MGNVLHSAPNFYRVYLGPVPGCLHPMSYSVNDRELLRRIERSPGQRAGYKQLVRELSLPGGRDRRLLVEQLARLTAAGYLVKLDRDHWAMPKFIHGAVA